MKIMTVDDSKIVRRFIVQAIELIDAESVEAGDGIEAIEQLQKDPEIDLILMDWNMPNMNGIECLRALQADDGFKHIPVMMVTTESESSRIAEALKAGAVNYVTKPCTPEVLATKILECLGEGDEEAD